MLKKLVGLFMLAMLCFQQNWTVMAAEEERDLVSTAQQFGYEITEAERPASFIAVDGRTGAILWGDNIDLQRDPASMTKLMTVYLVYEAIAQGKLTEETMITASETDQAVSQIYEISNNKIVAGVDYPVRDLLTAALVKSSNAAIFMLSNYISDNGHSKFVDRMNLTAERLGMKNTYFYNASGAVASAYQGYYLPDRYDLSAFNVTTARDLAILAYHIVKDYPQALDHTDDYEVAIMAGTEYEENFESYNLSLPGGKYAFDGVNGLKTGSSPSAQFNSVVTARRGDQEVITVVMGVGDWYDEHSEDYRQIFVNTLLEQSFIDLSDQVTSDQAIFPAVSQSNSMKKLPEWGRLLAPVVLMILLASLALFFKKGKKL